MNKMASLLKKSFLSFTVVLLTAFFPGIAVADPASTVPSVAADTDSQPCVAPPSTQPGVHQPVGADAHTYTYNCDTGLWENTYYTFDPATGIVSIKPAYAPTYAYNSSTGLFDTTTYVYNDPTGKYVARTVSVAQPPAGAVITVPAPALAPQTSASPSSSGTADPSTVKDTSALNATTDDTTTAGVNNTIGSQATTGDALVLANTSAGDATSGNAQGIVNIINALQSSGSLPGGNLVTFESNIDGDVNGDLILDPTELTQPASNSKPLDNTDNNVTVNSQTGEQITNNVTVGATSGNATVTENTSAGNATSGTANAVANIVNMLNSIVSGGKSFLGVININGNLNGDILLPQDFVNQLLADNVPTTTIDTSQIQTNNTIADITNNQAINNNVTTTAASGQAAVTTNTQAGNATTGNGSTNITVFNLTGSNVIGSNDLLVFVNVLGKWVGMIMSAPVGATAAELGGGITSNTSANNNTDVNVNNNQQITNNVNVNAQSGDATVDRNTKAGNATSGNATASANLLNIENSNLAFANWFGMLFINVFGTWNGSFGVNTSAGDKPSAPSSNGSTPPVQVFKFVPSTGNAKTFNSGTPFITYSSGNSGSTTPSVDSQNAVLAAHVASDPTTTKNFTLNTHPTTTPVHHNYVLPAAGVIFAVFLLASERIRFFHRGPSV
jgi:hypothetical protein